MRKIEIAAVLGAAWMLLAPLAAAQEAAESPERREGTDLREIIAAVAASTDRRFFVDPRVRATVTTTPELDVPTLADLEAILGVHGYVTIESDVGTVVIPDAIVRSVATPLVEPNARDVEDWQIVTTVLEVDAETAGTLVPVLRPLMPQWAHLAAHGNTLVIVDRFANVRRVVEIAERLAN